MRPGSALSVPAVTAAGRLAGVRDAHVPSLQSRAVSARVVVSLLFGGIYTLVFPPLDWGREPRARAVLMAGAQKAPLETASCAVGPGFGSA